MTKIKTSINQKKKIDVYIVEPQPLYAEGLNLAFSHSETCRVAGISHDYRSAVEELMIQPAHVVVTDIYPYISKGLEFTADVLRNIPGLKVLVLSMLDEQIYAERALKAGARGYIMKTSAARDVVSAVEKVYKNEFCLSDNISSAILQKYVGGVDQIELNPVKLLTDRELDVYRLTGKGFTSREIASMLGISINTADNHKTSIKDKLGLKNAVELVRSSVLWYKDE